MWHQKHRKHDLKIANKYLRLKIEGGWRKAWRTDDETRNQELCDDIIGSEEDWSDWSLKKIEDWSGRRLKNFNFSKAEEEKKTRKRNEGVKGIFLCHFKFFGWGRCKNRKKSCTFRISPKTVVSLEFIRYRLLFPFFLHLSTHSGANLAPCGLRWEPKSVPSTCFLSSL